MSPLPIDASATNDNTPVRLSVVVPAYNESARLTRTLQATAAYMEARRRSGGWDWELIVVDDGSRDDTADVAQQWAKGQTEVVTSRVRVLRYEMNRG